LIVETSTGSTTQYLPQGVAKSLSISDDGQVIVYSANGNPVGGNPDEGFEVFRVMADGTHTVQLSSSATQDATSAMISGNGQRVTYESGGQVFTIPSLGGPPTLIGPGTHPSITDDGAWVYYSAMDQDNLEIHRAAVSTPIPQRLTNTSPPLSNDRPLVSGNGSRVAFVRLGTVQDPAARTLMRMNGDGSTIEQLGTAETDWTSRDPEIASDGRRVVFVGGPRNHQEVFRVQADGSNLVQITRGAEARHPSVADSGETVVFESSLNLTGNNPCGTSQIFRVGANGAGLAQLSPSGDCSNREYPRISRDGSTVVYEQDTTRLYAVHANGGTPTLVAESSTYALRPRLSRDGSLVAFISDGNPGEYSKAFLARTDASEVIQVSSYPSLLTSAPDITANGEVAYSQWEFPNDSTCCDSVWLYSDASETSTLVRPLYLTDHVRISGNGQYIFTGRMDRIRTATGEAEPFRGLEDPRVSEASISYENDASLAVDEVGRVVFSGLVNWTGENPDLNQEIWLVDFEAAPRWEIETTAPARVSWSPDPFASTYDLIRGDLANLGFGPGGAVDLGEVVCLVNDTFTPSAIDPEQPAADRGFFYLFRSDGDAGWGASSSGAPHVPGTGACP
jgi:Tol biopolymer transport system component